MGRRVGGGGVVFVCGSDRVDNGGACGLSRREKDGKTPFFISEHRPTHGLMPPFSTARGSGGCLYPQLALWATNLPSALPTVLNRLPLGHISAKDLM